MLLSDAFGVPAEHEGSRETEYEAPAQHVDECPPVESVAEQRAAGDGAYSVRGSPLRNVLQHLGQHLERHEEAAEKSQKGEQRAENLHDVLRRNEVTHEEAEGGEDH